MTYRGRVAHCTWTFYYFTVVTLLFEHYASSIKIRPNSCTNAVGDSGTCMFVWQCIKQDGVQLGPCVDRFLVGACCRLPEDNLHDNLVPGASDGQSALAVQDKPRPTSTTTRPPSTTVRPTAPSAVTSSLTMGTSSSMSPSTVSPTLRPIASAPLIGQSAEGQPLVGRPPPVTAAPTGEDYSECGLTRQRPKGKVVGGTHSSFGEWPWQVSVRRSSFFGFASTHRCGGAILSANWVATAGHCVDDLLKSNIRIRVGEYDFSTDQEPLPHQERGVEKKVVHPRYNFFTYENDLALLRLDAPLVLQPHVRPICLPPESAAGDALVGVNATVTGWGRLSEGGSLPNKLQQVQVPIISNAKCQQMFKTAGRQESIPDIFLCAGYEAGGRDSCQGDSGGPLQTKGKDGRWFLAGIISWGIGCAEPNMPGVCTRITKFKEWILKTTS